MHVAHAAFLSQVAAVAFATGISPMQSTRLSLVRRIPCRFTLTSLAVCLALASQQAIAQGTDSQAASADATGEAAFFRLEPPGGFLVTPDLVTLIVSLPNAAQ